MKGLIRIYLFHLLALFFAHEVFGAAFEIRGPLANIFVAAAILTVLNVLLKPVLKLVFLPINALTLGLFSFVITAGNFYVFVRLLPFISISGWRFPGVAFKSLSLPAADLGFWGTVLVIALSISLFTNFLAWISE